MNYFKAERNIRVLTAVVLFVFQIAVMLLMFSCSSNLLKQAPPLAPEERFYKIDKEKGYVFHNRCEKLEGEDRKCTLTRYRIADLWDVLYPSFILIRKDKVFK